jgi:tripartite-type tricarboxylate transporter receptor subunit TctC
MLQASGAVLLSLLTATTALAQESYPGSREVHVIVAFGPGTGPDIHARYFSENMRPFLGGTIVVENKVGASGNIAIAYVAKAKPDGYTILMPTGNAIAAGPALFKNPGYDPSEFAVLGSICRFPFTVVVAANSPHKTLQSLITAVRTKGSRMLDEEEQRRADRFHFPVDREAFTAAHETRVTGPRRRQDKSLAL